MQGFKKLFSIKNFVEFLKGIFKISLILIIVTIVIFMDIKVFTQYQYMTVGGIVLELKLIVYHILVVTTIFIAIIAAIDFSFQKYQYFNELKMSKQELKEEQKQTEGNPEIKQKIRQLRSEQIKKRLDNVVPEATVVIMNPEHYAVALKYNKHMNAPVCIIKGLDLIAQRIKSMAQEHKIPVIENPRLARGLYKDANLDQEIPQEYYSADAEVISYVMSLEQKTKEKKMRYG